MAIELNASLSLGDIIQTGGIMLALGTFVLQNRSALRAQRNSVYQTLELESIEVFKFEAEHRTSITPFKRPVARADELEKLKKDAVSQMLARKYYEMTCNLFEISIRFHRTGIITPDIFASWTAWYFDQLTEWGFRALWNELRPNYTSELRVLFDPYVSKLTQEWDIAALDGTTVSEEAIEAVRCDFYQFVGVRFDSAAVKNWLRTVGPELEPRHPYAFD